MNAIQQKIINAFDPIVNLLQGMAYPVTLIMISIGFLILTMGNKHTAIKTIKWAIVGFLGMQFVPAIMKLLMEVAAAMK